MTKSKLDQTLSDFEKEVSNFISTDIVEIATGLSIGGGSDGKGFDSKAASAFFAEVIKSNAKGLQALGGQERLGRTQEILISTDRIHILLTILGETGFYHGLAIEKEGNLGFSRLLMKKYSPAFIKIIGEITGST